MIDRIFDIVMGWEFLSALVLVLLLNAFAAVEKWKSFKKGGVSVARPGESPFYVVDWDLR